MGYRIELEDPSGDLEVISPDDVLDVDIQRPHTALSDWKATIPYSAKGARDWTTSVVQVRIYFVRADGSSGLLFRGYLERSKSDERNGTTTLEGRGIGRDLMDGEVSIRFQDIETHAAIGEIWAMTDWDATVYNPSTVSAETTAQDTENGDTFSDILTIAADQPVFIQNGEVKTYQTAFTVEGEAPTSSTGTSVVSDAEYSGGDAIRITGSASAYWDFTPQYDIPADQVRLYVREAAATSTPDLDIQFGPVGNLTTIDTLADADGPITLGWRDYATNPRNGDGYTGGDLQAGTTYRLQIAATNSDTNDTDDYDVDVVAPLDDRWPYDLDNDNGGASGYLDGPQTHPIVTVNFDQVDVTDNIDAVTLTTTWDDTSDGQGLAASNDGGDNFPLSVSNSDLLDDNFTQTYGTRLVGQATIGRYGTRDTATPRTGYQSQALQSWTLKYDGNPVSTIEDKRFSGDLLSIQQKLHKKAGYRFAIDPTTTPPTVESFETGSQERDATYTVVNRNPSRDVFDYANKVTVYGELLDDGTRPKATAENEDEIKDLGGYPDNPDWREDGTRHVTLVRPDLSNLDDVRSEARSEVASRVGERSDTGELSIQPENVLPGYNYPVDWYSDGNPTSTPLEKVSFNEQHEGADGSLQFNRRRGTAISIVQSKYAQSITDDAI